MRHESSLFRQPRPTPPRLRLEVPCVLHFADGDVAARLFNLSYQGAGVELAEDTPPERLKSLRDISFAETGRLPVLIRWRRSLRIGLRFAQVREARPALDAFFRATGDYPV